MLHRKFFDWKNIGRFHIGKQSRVGHRRRRGVQAPLQTEILEDRTLLTNFLVDTLDDVVADDDRISLREAIASANLNAAPNDDLAAGEDDGDTISFAAAIAGGTILLDVSLGQLEITDDLDIDGSDPNMLSSDITISGQNTIRLFQIDTMTAVGSNTAVSLSNLILTAGSTEGSPGDDGGAMLITDGEEVTLDSLMITGSSAASSGGGVWSGDGMLTVTNSQIGESMIDHDVWSRSGATTDDTVFAYVESQYFTPNVSDPLDILNNSGTTIFSSTNPLAAGVEVDEAGNVFFDVGNTGSVINSTRQSNYSIHTSVVSQSDRIAETETNDTVQTADAIVEDVLIVGELGTANDVDYFSIPVIGYLNEKLIVVLDNDPEDDGVSITNSHIEILANDGVSVLASSRFSGQQSDVAIGIDPAFINSGHYYVRIRSNDGTTGTYQFVAKLAGPSDRVEESENNDDAGMANSLTATEFGAGAISRIPSNRAIRGGGISINGGTLDLDTTVLRNNGTIRDPDGNVSGGGGILNDSGVVTVRASSVIEFNGVVGGYGGGISNLDGELNILGAQIQANFATFGGGIGNGAFRREGNLFVDGASIQRNYGTFGGGVYNRGGATATIQSGTTIGSNIGSGGGILNYGELTVMDSLITQNSSGATGGGILNNSEGDLTVRNSVISNNSTARDGGGILSLGLLTIDSSEIHSNHADDDAGGIYISGGSGATIGNTRIYDNFAATDAGGLAVISSRLLLENSEVARNTTDGDGGGIYSQRSPSTSIRNSVIVDNFAKESGGGIRNQGLISSTRIDSNLSLSENSVVSGNTAGRRGGGIYNTNGTIEMDSATLSDNVADGVSLFDGGGGLYSKVGTVDLANATISGNHSQSGGGGIWTGPGTITIDESLVDGNTASGAEAGNGGGGVFNSGGMFVITSSVISNNIANGMLGLGGGINNAGGSVNITTSTLTGNLTMGTTSTSSGGAIYSSGDTTINTSTIHGNSAASSGGAINTGGGSLELTNVTVSGNTSGALGGAIRNSFGTANIRNSTIANNRTQGPTALAGGIFHTLGPGGGTVILTSTLVADNSAPGIVDIFGDVSGDGSSSFNLISVAASNSGLTHGENDNQIGASTNPIDAGLEPLADNGGPTLTHAILPNSPAINAGNNPSNLMTDQRGTGFLRVFGGQADIGAFERQAMDIERNEILVTATGPGADGIVEVSNAITHDQLFSIEPYPGFTGGVRVATGDVNGDGTMDIITGAGPEGGPHVKVFDGKDGTSELFSFFAYDATFTGGIFVAAADLNGDDLADIITGAGEGGGPHVKAFSGVDGSELFSFMAYNAQPGTGFTGGVRVAAGDVTGDGVPDIITGAGPRGGPHVRVFDGATPVTHGGETNDIGGAIGSYFAYQSTPLFKGGIFVSAGEFDGLPGMEIVTAAGTGGGPHIRVASPATFTGTNFLADFMAYDISYGGGVSVATIDWNDDGNPDILTGQLQGSNAEVRVFDGTDDLTVFYPTPLDSLTPLSEQTPPLVGGVYVAGEAALGTGLGSPLKTAQTALVVNDELVPLTQVQLTLIAKAILERVEWSGLNAQQQQTLADATFLVRDLPSDLLGLTRPGQIVLDVDAAGYGWFIDPTPELDEEFGRITEWGKLSNDAEISQQLDLLTVVSHEFAHLLGTEDRQGDSWTLMAPTLNVGTRKLFDQRLLDELFAGSDLADALLGGRRHVSV